MRITGSSDWRDGIPFETPVLVADVVPGDPTFCAICGRDSGPRERTELWAVKHRNPKNHAGHVRFYCAEHMPVVPVYIEPTEAARARPGSTRRTPPPRTAAPRATAAPDKVRPVCPTCFIEVPASGVCGNCGETVA